MNSNFGRLWSQLSGPKVLNAVKIVHVLLIVFLKKCLMNSSFKDRSNLCLLASRMSDPSYRLSFFKQVFFLKENFSQYMKMFPKCKRMQQAF